MFSMKTMSLAAGAALAASAAAQASVPIGLTFSHVGTFDPGGATGLVATESGGIVTLSTGNGTGFAYAVYNLDDPERVQFIDGMTYTISQLAASTAYTANPLLLVDADESGGINPGTAPPDFFYSLDPADLGNTGPGTGDSFISSDVNTNATAQVGQGFQTYTLIGAGSSVSGWYGTNATQDGFFGYSPWSGVQTAFTGGGYGGTQGQDPLYQVYIILGGSGSFANTSVQISDVTLSAVPEPASFGVLGLGSLMALRRRRRA